MDARLIHFIQQHEKEDVTGLLLKHKEILGYPAVFVANQINGRSRAREKLPTWYSNPAIVYPPQQHLEQSSSETTAQFKCEIIDQFTTLHQPYGSLVDLTGGFGVDTFLFSKIFKEVLHVEPVEDLCRLAAGAHQRLGATNIKHIHSTAEQFLDTRQNVDWVYIDPSRKIQGRKVYRFADCQPNVLALQQRLSVVTKNWLVKASPLIDLKQGLRELPNTKQVFVVSVENECKEVLFLIQDKASHEARITCVDLSRKEEAFEFSFSEEEATNAEYSSPQQFVYEPTAAILKAGAFKLIGKRFNLKKLHPNTHLFTGQQVQNFPGRIFRIDGELTHIDTQLPDHKANIISRNYPLAPEQIKKKYHLQDGGEKYLLAFSGKEKKYLLVSERLK